MNPALTTMKPPVKLPVIPTVFARMNQVEAVPHYSVAGLQKGLKRASSPLKSYRWSHL
jgi:hypothetical protein